MPDEPAERKPVSFKLTKKARAILKALAEDRGISQAAQLEVLLREEVERRGVTPSTDEQ
jgi:hypothetical protein